MPGVDAPEVRVAGPTAVGVRATRRAARLACPPRPGRCPLFGHHLRFLFMLDLALHGPGAAYRVGRAIGTSLHQAFAVATALERCGVVTKARRVGGRFFVDLDDRAFPCGELRRLLLRLAPIYGVGLRRGERGGGASRPPRVRGDGRSESLFGTPGRTRALLALAAVGEIDQSGLARLSGVGLQSMSNVVAHWERAGVVRGRMSGFKRMLSLDPAHAAAPELLAVLERLVASTAPFADVGRRESARVERASGPSPVAFPFDAAALVCIGRRPQARVLLALAVHGPARAVDLAAHLGVSEEAVRSTGGSLVRLGLVARTVARGRPVDLWFALDPRHPLAPELKAYLDAIARICPAPEFGDARPPPKKFPPRVVASRSRLARLCGYDMRVRTLACVFRRPGCEEAEIARSLRTKGGRVGRHLRALALRGHVTFAPERGVMRARLNPGFVAAPELRAMLAALVDCCSGYAFA